MYTVFSNKIGSITLRSINLVDKNVVISTANKFFQSQPVSLEKPYTVKISSRSL